MQKLQFLESAESAVMWLRRLPGAESVLFVIVDDDKVCLTNINRQIIATRKTVGKYKVDVMTERILEINPDAKWKRENVFICRKMRMSLIFLSMIMSWMQ